MRPEMVDIRPGDTVRWREGERLIQAIAAEVRRDDLWLHISVEAVTLLPPEAFFP